MKQLLIIVPQDSLLNSYLMNSSRVYDKISELEGMVWYQQPALSYPMETINYLITMFMLSDFSISCNHGDYIFRVRS